MWITPKPCGRLREDGVDKAELASQAQYILGAFTIYHDHLLQILATTSDVFMRIAKGKAVLPSDTFNVLVREYPFIDTAYTRSHVV